MIDSDWRNDIESALTAFITVAKLAGDPITSDEIEVQYLDAPHRPPACLPDGKMAVYGFWGDSEWLKIGKVGPNSNARYTSQHYSQGSAQSTLAGSLANDKHMLELTGFDPSAPGKWIKVATHRANILLPASCI